MPNIYCVQVNSTWEDKPASFKRVLSLLENTVIEPDSLILLPEMFATGFSMNVDVTAKDEPEYTRTFLQRLAQTYSSHVMGGLVVREDSRKGKNLSVTVSPEGAICCRYQKIQPITPAGESDAHEAGNTVRVFAWRDFTVAPFICFDLRFPEWFRRGALQGADLFVVIASWPEIRIQHWITLLQARAVENQGYVVGVNRCGDDPNAYMPGRSLIVDPMGEIIRDAGNEECIIHADIHIDAVRRIRDQLPFLKEMKR